MLTEGHIKALRGIYLKRLTLQRSYITIEFAKVVSEGQLHDFIGENETVWENPIDLQCLYNGDISEVDRSKFGIKEDVDTIFYISPDELKGRLGEENFKERILKTKSGLRVLFDGKYYIPKKIEEMEPDKFKQVIGIEMHMKEVV